MKQRLQKILSKKHFFNTIYKSSDNLEYTITKPSQMLIRNVYVNWLQYINLRTQKIMPVFLNKKVDDMHKIGMELPFGMITHMKTEQNKEHILNYDLNAAPRNLDLEFKLIIPRDNLMQYFTQWQRYRKYWWSSITTTPSLFSIGDMQQTESKSEVGIVASFSSGTVNAEFIKVHNMDDKAGGNACLTCAMSLERALLITLLDGLNEDNYLRLHRKIAPFKMSFGLDFQDVNKKEDLKELASLLFHHLKLERISGYLPDFSKSLEDQINENLEMGIPYTAILNESTLENGIFHLMSSSTTLKEQIHVADFQPYAALICGGR